MSSSDRGSPFTGPHLSHSQIEKYLLCPEQYRLYYVEGLRPKLVPASLIFGKLIHQSLARFFRSGESPATWFHQEWADVKDLPMAYSSRESWEKLSLMGESLLATFVTEDAPRLKNIRKVEHPFTLTISELDLPLVGVIDLVADLDGKPTVVDFKTSGSGYDGHEAPMSDQLTAYRLAEPAVPQAALCVLVKLKEPRIEWQRDRAVRRAADRVPRESGARCPGDWRQPLLQTSREVVFVV